MRNRNLILFLTVLVAAFLVAGCGQMRQLKQDEKDRLDNIQAMLEMAEAKGAKECAPKEYAVAKADLDHARLECTQAWEACKAGEKPAAEGLKAQQSVDALFKALQVCEDKKKIPTCGLVAEPDTIAPGKCAMLKWSGENVEQIVMGPDEKAKGAEKLPLSGIREVCPKETTDYQMSCVGKYSTNYEAATVTVAAPKPVAAPAPAPAPVVAAPAPAPAAKKELALRVNFDTAKWNIRPADLAELQKGVQFLKDNPGAKIHIVGYTDSRGGDKYNQKLSEKRAEAVKKYLEGEVEIKPDQITSEGKGKADPIGDNKTKEGQFQNRRVMITIK
jgi:outer membrane protein OmpA-like peptidoglycan-associated protein